MLKNKHVIVSLIVAPILAIMSYFAVDAMVAETPHAAKPGESVQLIEKPNCRYTSGACDLKNGDFEVRMRGEWLDGVQILLTLESTVPLDGIVAAHVTKADETTPPLKMKALDNSGLRWGLNIINPDLQIDRLRLAASSKETLYFGDAALTFINYETSFNNDFRK